MTEDCTCLEPYTDSHLIDHACPIHGSLPAGKFAALRELCLERAAAEGTHGEDGAAIWPEEILAILDADS